MDCSDYQSEAKASREMARQLAENLDSERNVPRVGIAAADYRDITWELLGDYDIDAFVVILDETVEEAALEERLRDIAYDVMLEYGTVFSVHAVSETTLEARADHPFFQTVLSEGRAIYG